jgi:hypothetical protein
MARCLKKWPQKHKNVVLSRAVRPEGEGTFVGSVSKEWSNLSPVYGW